MASDSESSFADDDFPEEEDDVSTRLQPVRLFPDEPALFKPLPKPFKVTKTIREISDMIKRKIVNFNPFYQREVVWKPPTASDLIKSWYRNIAIPPVIFDVNTPNAGDFVYAQDNPSFKERQVGEDQKVVLREQWDCADGKQRLTTMMKFLEGEIPLIDDETGDKYFFKKPPAVTKPSGKIHLLSDRMKEQFLDMEIDCICYEALEEGQVEELFKKIQQGMGLTEDEILRTAKTPWAEFIAELQYEYGLKPKTGFNGRIVSLLRAKDFTAFCAIAYQHHHIQGDFENASSWKHADLDTFIRDTRAPSQSDKNRLTEILERLRKLSLMDDGSKERETRGSHEVFYRPRLTGNSLKTLAPVEFYLISALVEHWWEWKDAEILEGLGQWREIINRTHQGNISHNAKVVKTAKNAVQIIERSKLRGIYDQNGKRLGRDVAPIPTTAASSKTARSKAKVPKPPVASTSRPPAPVASTSKLPAPVAPRQTLPTAVKKLSDVPKKRPRVEDNENGDPKRGKGPPGASTAKGKERAREGETERSKEKETVPSRPNLTAAQQQILDIQQNSAAHFRNQRFISSHEEVGPTGPPPLPPSAIDRNLPPLPQPTLPRVDAWIRDLPDRFDSVAPPTPTSTSSALGPFSLRPPPQVNSGSVAPPRPPAYWAATPADPRRKPGAVRIKAEI